MNIFFDLDGTLLDSKERLYRLFQVLVKESELSFEQYWGFKQNKITHKQILTNTFFYSTKNIAEFEEKWMSQIELPQWLALDKPFEGVTAYLNELNKTHQLYLVTSRQSKSAVLEQIAKYDWVVLFNEVLVTKQRTGKYDLLKNEVEVKKEDWIVGDTGYDIEVGHKLGIHTAAVKSGFQNSQSLLNSKPEIIVDNVTLLKF